MAIIWNKIIPRWGGTTIEPPEAKKDEGYLIDDVPPASWENWLRKGTYEALDETRDVIEDIDEQLAQKVSKADIIQTVEVNDVTKIPSSAVTFGLNTKIIPFLPYANQTVGNCIITASKINNLIHLNISSNINTPNNGVAGVLPIGIRPVVAEITVFALAKQSSGVGVVGISIMVNGNIVVSAQDFNEPIRGWNISLSYPI